MAREISPRALSSGTKFTWELRKPHAGLIQFVIVFPGGDYYVWRQIEFHGKAKVDSNVGAISKMLPEGWLVETEEERSARLAQGRKP